MPPDTREKAMTQTTVLPEPLSELGAESAIEQDLCRVTLLIGSTLLDVALPTRVSIGALVDDVVVLANDQAPAARGNESAPRLDETRGRWTLARIGREPIEPHRSLAEAGVVDGDVLQVTDVEAPTTPLLFDDVDHQHGVEPDAFRRRLAEGASRAAWCGAAVALALAAAFILPAQAAAGSLAAAVALASGAVCVVIAVLAGRSEGERDTSKWWLSVGLPLIFGGALYVVPGGHGVTALPMAIGLTGFAALLVLLISRRNRALHTAVIGIAVLTAPAAVAELLWQPNPRAVGAILATVAVIAVYLSPRVTIAMAKLPIPRVPTAGEPLDDIETAGGTAVDGVNAIGKQLIPTEEGMAERVRRANEYLTGILVAAAVAAVLGSVLAVDTGNGFFWQGTVFAAAVATVLCLRGRSHHDLAQAATMIGAGLAVALATVVKTAMHVESQRVEAALALVGLMVLVGLCGLLAPRVEFSPVQRRLVEIGEYLAVAMVFPLCFWIVRVYAYFRELNL
jgi:type VII secretion integral membrane protein EccD